MIEITQQEKAILEVFTADTAMFDAVQKIAKGRIEKERDMFIRNRARREGKTPSDVGTQIQVFDEAIFLVDGIFRDLRQFKQTDDILPVNPGR